MGSNASAQVLGDATLAHRSRVKCSWALMLVLRF